MKIALFLPDGMDEEYQYIVNKVLDNICVSEIHVATTKAYNMASVYAKSKNTRIILHKSGRKTSRLYQAINNSNEVIFFYNGNTPSKNNPSDGYLTSKALINAINKNKSIKIYPYRYKSISVSRFGDFLEISFFGKLNQVSPIKKIFLSKKDTLLLMQTIRLLFSEISF